MYIFTLSNSPQIQPQEDMHPTLSPLIVLPLWVQFVSHYSWVLDQLWTTVNLPGVTTLKKTDSSLSPTNYQTPIVVPQLEVGILCFLPCLHSGLLSGLICVCVCMLTQLLWVYMHKCPTVSGKFCFLEVISQFCSYNVFTFPLRDAWALKGGMWYEPSS